MNAARKQPIACLVSASRRNQSTSRGEYCPAANWTTTSTLASTKPVNAIIPVAVAVRMSRAVPMPTSDGAATSRRWSSSGTSSPSRIAATRYRTGTTIRLCR